MSTTLQQERPDFWEDFSFADLYDDSKILETYERIFNQWNHNHLAIADLIIATNHKLWQWWERSEETNVEQEKEMFTKRARLYEQLWLKTDAYAHSNFEGEQLAEILRIID